MSGSDSAIKLLDVVRATLRTTFPPRFELRGPRLFFDLRFVAAKVAADYAQRGHFGKAKFAISRERWPVHLGSLPRCFAQSAKIFVYMFPASCRKRQASGLCFPEMGVLRAAHVRACAGVDFDRFAFLYEKRHVNGLTGFQLCRLGDVTRSIATQTFR